MNDGPRKQHVAKWDDTTLLRVAKIQTFAGGQALTNATGFFFLQNGFLFLITARHVVINEAFGHRPDRLRLSLHSSDEDLQLRHDISIPLYVCGVPQWHQHPKCSVDVVAVTINDPHVLSKYCVDTFQANDILEREHDLPLGQDLLIVGFPLGFYDRRNNLPIVRRATVASSFSHPFNGEPYFLTDARLHRGMSGSPVVARLSHGADVPSQRDARWHLLGVHSSSLDVSDRDPGQDERLALNTTWYASLIPQMLPVPLAPNDAENRCGHGWRTTKELENGRSSNT